MATVVLDAGHGGSDPGAVYNGRQEKDDVLRLTKAVGAILERNGVNVEYTRTNDIYDTPFQKATKANATGADLLISIHRNSGTNPNTYNGAQTLVYSDDGIRARLARNINNELVDLGFRDAGIVERPNLVVLKRSSMPAALVEVGFINNEADNRLFDDKFNQIAQGIADGILTTLYGGQGDADDSRAVQTNASANNDFVGREFEAREQMEYNNMMGGGRNMVGNEENMMDNSMMTDGETMPANGKLYRVQVGAYRNKENADRILNSLLMEGFPAFMIYDDGLYRVQVGAYEFLPNAIRMEARLRRKRYNTYITT